jgi:hypothetical protein
LMRPPAGTASGQVLLLRGRGECSVTQGTG